MVYVTCAVSVVIRQNQVRVLISGPLQSRVRSGGRRPRGWRTGDRGRRRRPSAERSATRSRPGPTGARSARGRGPHASARRGIRPAARRPSRRRWRRRRSCCRTEQLDDRRDDQRGDPDDDRGHDVGSPAPVPVLGSAGAATASTSSTPARTPTRPGTGTAPVGGAESSASAQRRWCRST